MQRASRLFFPPASRRLPAQRWLKITLRTLHLLGTAGVGGAFLYGAAESAWMPYLWLVIASGAGMLALEVWSNGIWLIQVRGLAIGLKLVLLAAIAWADAPALPLFVAVIAISGVISHAPGDVRYFSPWHGRRVESLNR
ncbi:MAG: hypothetical protein PVF40_01215 [Ectothiorhodospiraceae bacterium]|jgi:hypothetical protein